MFLLFRLNPASSLFDINSAFYQGEFWLQLAFIEAGGREALPALHLYESKAKYEISAFLRQQPTWLGQLYPDLENILKTFDETAQTMFRGPFIGYGFTNGAVAAFFGDQASQQTPYGMA